jgi:hypothetical protein
MKKAGWIVLFALVSCLAAAGPTALAAPPAASVAASQANGNAFGFEVLKNPLGKLVLSLRIEVAASGLHLGVSLYPPKVVNTLEEGRHFAFPLKSGLFTKEFEIDPSFEGGTFEAAVWTQRLSKDQVPADDAVARKLGYKLTGMAAYIWGVLRAR